LKVIAITAQPQCGGFLFLQTIMIIVVNVAMLVVENATPMAFVLFVVNTNAE
jgi:hypothetical protein